MRITDALHAHNRSGAVHMHNRPTGSNRSDAYRFVTLVDVLYEHRVRLLVAADAMPFELFEDVLTQQDGRDRVGVSSGNGSRNRV